MKVTVLTFAQLKDYFAARFEVELADHSQVSELLAELKSRQPGSSDILKSCRVALSEELIKPTDRLVDGAEVALLPPSSGG